MHAVSIEDHRRAVGRDLGSCILVAYGCEGSRRGRDRKRQIRRGGRDGGPGPQPANDGERGEGRRRSPGNPLTGGPRPGRDFGPALRVRKILRKGHPCLADIAQACLGVAIQAPPEQVLDRRGRRQLIEIDRTPQHVGERVRDRIAAEQTLAT